MLQTQANIHLISVLLPLRHDKVLEKLQVTTLSPFLRLLITWFPTSIIPLVSAPGIFGSGYIFSKELETTAHHDLLFLALLRSLSLPNFLVPVFRKWQLSSLIFMHNDIKNSLGTKEILFH